MGKKRSAAIAASRDDLDNDLEEIDRDIRKHDLEDDAFEVNFTDSTCKFSYIVKEVREPGMQYKFERNTAQDLTDAFRKKWHVVSPDRLRSVQIFSDRERPGYLQDCISVGDTVLLERDDRYGAKERAYYENQSVGLVRSALEPMNKTGIRDYRKPFAQ